MIFFFLVLSFPLIFFIFLHQFFLPVFLHSPTSRSKPHSWQVYGVCMLVCCVYNVLSIIFLLIFIFFANYQRHIWYISSYGCFERIFMLVIFWFDDLLILTVFNLNAEFLISFLSLWWTVGGKMWGELDIIMEKYEIELNFYKDLETTLIGLKHLSTVDFRL